MSIRTGAFESQDKSNVASEALNASVRWPKITPNPEIHALESTALESSSRLGSNLIAETLASALADRATWRLIESEKASAPPECRSFDLTHSCDGLDYWLYETFSKKPGDTLPVCQCLSKSSLIIVNGRLIPLRLSGVKRRSRVKRRRN
jgi:hypothetical protein